MLCSNIASIAMGFELGSDKCAEFPREEMELMCCPLGGVPEIDGGTATTTATPAVKSSTSEIDGGTATTTATPTVETTASPESIEAALGGLSFSGFGGFTFVSIVSAAWAVGFV